MKKIILTVILAVTILGAIAQQNDHNSLNHIKTGVNTNVSAFFAHLHDFLPFHQHIAYAAFEAVFQLAVMGVKLDHGLLAENVVFVAFHCKLPLANYLESF